MRSLLAWQHLRRRPTGYRRQLPADRLIGARPRVNKPASRSLAFWGAKLSRGAVRRWLADWPPRSGRESGKRTRFRRGSRWRRPHWPLRAAAWSQRPVVKVHSPALVAVQTGNALPSLEAGIGDPPAGPCVAAGRHLGAGSWGIGGITSWDPARSHQPVPPRVPGRNRDAAARVRAAAVAARAGPDGPPGHPAVGVALRGRLGAGALAAVIWCVPPGVASGFACGAETG